MGAHRCNARVTIPMRPLGAVLAAALLTAPWFAAAADVSQRIELATDGEWLTLSGKVAEVARGYFTFDYGPATLAVEMDGYDWSGASAVSRGDRVTVSGRMDMDFFEERRIEARIVYLQSRGELLYADVSDEESSAPGPVFRDHVRAERAPDPMEDGEWVSLTGAVARISPGSFRLDTGRQEYTVDTSGLAYDRFDPGSARRIRAGDRVIVFGAFEDGDLFERRQIEASTITKLSRAD